MSQVDFYHGPSKNLSAWSEHVAILDGLAHFCFAGS
jgi:hypothetical protein